MKKKPKKSGSRAGKPPSDPTIPDHLTEHIGVHRQGRKADRDLNFLCSLERFEKWLKKQRKIYGHGKESRKHLGSVYTKDVPRWIIDSFEEVCRSRGTSMRAILIRYMIWYAASKGHVSFIPDFPEDEE